MANKIYALLVGIDNYHPQSEVRSLEGCVNDIEAIEKYLEVATQHKVSTENENTWELVPPKKLINSSATRQAVIDGFLEHLTQADSEDVVFFYYAGHGSCERVPQAFETLELNDRIETLVCHDSRTPGVPDLADKELSYLIEKVAQKNPHILIVLDSCHSGTATRDPEVLERQINSDGKARDLKDFIFDREWINRRLSKDYQRPKHIAIAACRDFQTAKEHRAANGQRRGAFSYYLTEALARTNGNLSYANLVQDINALITGKVKDQSPQIEAKSDDLIQTFLGGAAGERINCFTFSYDKQKNNSWVINGGILHGIRPTSEGDTLIAVFPQGSTQEELQNIDNAICKAKLTKVFTEVSVASIIDGNRVLSENEPLWAIVTDVPLPKLKLCIQGEANGVEFARTELAKTNSGQPSLFVRETESLIDADYYLEAVEGQFWIKQPDDKKPLLAPIPEVKDTQGYTTQRANQIVKRLEHIARWKNILELKTPPTSQIKTEDVEMEVIINSGDNQYSSKTETSAMRGEYTWDGMALEAPGFNVKVNNKSTQDIHFRIIELNGNYSIKVPDLFDGTSSIVLPKGKVAEGEEIEIKIPKEYLDNGINEYDSILKLIVSTREFDASLLTQPGLDNPPPKSRSSDLPGTLNQLMNQVYSRDSGRRVKDKKIDNWMTQEVKVTLIKPPGGVEIKETESTSLLSGVQLQGHPNFKGKFSINPLPPSSRNINSNIVPPIFIQEQTSTLRGGKRLSEPYNFNMTRGGGGNKSVIEIVEVQNHESVTPQNPIKILIDKQLQPDEYILPIAYDGEFFLPLGKAKSVNGKTEITIESLPEPTSDSRSVQGSIKILFQKVVYENAGKRLGMNFPYPLLRIANVSESGRVTYNINANEIKAKVASADNILLYIHGIIGDTESILKNVKSAFVEDGNQKSLVDKYDLVLAFDYENLNTTIQENAKLLKQKLEEIGITANHGKQLHIVAHSMGGLVSRCFIEEEGGNQIVQHLVMLGTPNAGSPWVKIQDWAFTALGIGLNQLSTIAWPLNIIIALLVFLEANDNALDQMKYQSDFIQSIAKNNDPNVQYTIIAGDRSITPEALVESANSSKIKRLMQKLFGTAVDNVVDKVFFQQPNDIAVTIESIKSVSLQRNPKPIIMSPIACDHNSYFTTQAGLDALVQALCAKSQQQPN